jgi:ApaG protein
LIESAPGKASPIPDNRQSILASPSLAVAEKIALARIGQGDCLGTAKMESTSKSSFCPDGAFVTVDDLLYTYAPLQAPQDRPHLFTYHLTIHNHSAQTLTILARKWIINYKDGQVDVVEGDKVIGKTPKLEPGKSFSYNSYHLVGMDAEATGAFHGMDMAGNRVSIPIPMFALRIPEEPQCS